jgi:solute:Na+ symporter, SSS family
VLLGGMVSVVLTDYIQFVVLTAGIGITTWWVLTDHNVGGLPGIVEAVRQQRPGYGLNPFVTVGGLGLGLLWIVWQSMHWIGTNTWQTQAFRTAATDSPRTAKTMWCLTAVNYFGRAVIPMLWGVAAIAYLSHTRSATEFAEFSTVTEKARWGMPTMLMGVLPAGIIGFMLAGMLAALMSTHSSYMLAWSGVITEDLLAPIVGIFGIRIPGWGRIWITRFFVLCLGTFLIVFGLWFKVKETIWGYLGLTGTMYIAGSSALVAMGLYWRRANATGAYLGLLCGALPGLVYLFARMYILLGNSYGFQAPGMIGWLDRELTEPRIGAISFPLGFLGLIVGSLLRRSPEQVSAFEQAPAPVEGGAA